MAGREPGRFGHSGPVPQRAGEKRFATVVELLETESGEQTPLLVSKVTDVKIRRGQKVRLETPGGGGFGDPAERDPDKLARDVRLGYVTPEAARRDYKARA